MPHLRGIIAKIRTGADPTDDRVYVGFLGKDGGREFPLDDPSFNDFQANSNEKYILGAVFDPVEASGARVSVQSTGIDENSPRRHHFDLSAIDYVYLRKAGSRRGADDDSFELLDAEVILFGANPQRRTFSWPHFRRIHLGNEFGQWAWLTEE